jgi:hypothetical protein
LPAENLIEPCRSKLKLMKRKISRTVIFPLVVVIAAAGFSFSDKVDLSAYKLEDEALCYDVPTAEQVRVERLNDQYQVFLGKSYIAFKEALAYNESRGNYSIVNELGYLGKYQFNRNTLKAIGIFNSQEFLSDTRLQEDAFHAFTARNKWILRKDIKRYVGTYVNGVKITESGILAAAHLAGAGNVKKYLRSGGSYAFEDAFGTSLRYYLKKFSGYDTSFVEAERKATVM